MSIFDVFTNPYRHRQALAATLEGKSDQAGPMLDFEARGRGYSSFGDLVEAASAEERKEALKVTKQADAERQKAERAVEDAKVLQAKAGEEEGRRVALREQLAAERTRLKQFEEASGSAAKIKAEAFDYLLNVMGEIGPFNPNAEIKAENTCQFIAHHQIKTAAWPKVVARLQSKIAELESQLKEIEA